MSVETHAPAGLTTAQLPQVTEPRNAGLPLDLEWVLGAQANTSAIERRTASLPARRSPPATPVCGPSEDADWPPLPEDGDGAGMPGPPSPPQLGPSRPPHGDEAAGANAGESAHNVSDGEVQEAGSAVTTDGDR